MERRKSREVTIGSVTIGGNHPVAVQSMTNTKTENIAATVDQIHRLTERGCEIIRCAVPTLEAAQAQAELSAITAGSDEIAQRTAELTEEQSKAVGEMALRVHKALGLAVYSRTDMIMDENGQLWSGIVGVL